MNKKVMILIVIVECILAILLIAVLGKAIENYHQEVFCEEVHFVNEQGEIIDDTTVRVKDVVQGCQLLYVIVPSDATDQSVTFHSEKPNDIFVDETGHVTFLKPTSPTTASITVVTKNGKTATVTVAPERDMSGIVHID